MTSIALLGVWGALTVLALVAAGVSLWLSVRTGSLSELTSTVRQLSLDVSELYDRVEHWTRRERVRKLRDGQESALQSQALPPRGSREYKTLLRQRLTGQRGNGT